MKIVIQFVAARRRYRYTLCYVAVAATVIVGLAIAQALGLIK